MRIVSLLPSATELLCDLGLRDSLVAISHECDYPSDVQSLPRLTSSILPEHLDAAGIDREVVKAVRENKPLYQINGDLLTKLKPDLIVTQGVCDVCAVNTGTVEQTLKLLPDVVDVPTLVLSGKTFEGILRDLRLIAEVTGTENVANERIGIYREVWRNLAANKPKTSPRVLMLEWSEPPFFGGHWVPEMVEVAGGVNVLGEVGFDSKRTNWQAIGFADPDIICVMCCGYGLEDNIKFAKNLYKLSELKHLRAIRNNKIWAFDANSYFSRPTPRIIRGVELLQSVFSGEQHVENEVKRVMGTLIRS
jgi:iron complex transport system substrate-binding protein